MFIVKINKKLLIVLSVLLIFVLSGCVKPVPQHSKGSLNGYAEENYGNISEIVSFEDTDSSNILTIKDALGFIYTIESESSQVSFDGSNFGYAYPVITDNYIEKYY